MFNTLARRSSRISESLAIASILACLFALIPSATSADECPPLGVSDYSDYFAGTNLTVNGGVRTGTVGIAECGEFIVAYEAVDMTPHSFNVPCLEGEDEVVQIRAVSGIFARRFLPNGDSYDNDPFILTIPGTGMHVNYHEQVFHSPSLAINRSNDVTVSFIGHAAGRDKIQLCECEWVFPPPECPCTHPVDAQLLLQSNFQFDNPPAPTPIPLSLFDWRVHEQPSAGISGDGSRLHVWGNLSGNQLACNASSQNCDPGHYEDFGWFMGSDFDSSNEILDCGN